MPTDPSDLNVPSIGIAELAGSQTVVRTVTSVAQENGWRTYDVSVDAPAGYDVTVICPKGSVRGTEPFEVEGLAHGRSHAAGAADRLPATVLFSKIKAPTSRAIMTSTEILILVPGMAIVPTTPNTSGRLVFRWAP